MEDYLDWYFESASEYEPSEWAQGKQPKCLHFPLLHMHIKTLSYFIFKMCPYNILMQTDFVQKQIVITSWLYWGPNRLALFERQMVWPFWATNRLTFLRDIQVGLFEGWENQERQMGWALWGTNRVTLFRDTQIDLFEKKVAESFWRTNWLTFPRDKQLDLFE